MLKDELDVAVLGDDTRDLLLEARAVRLEFRDEVHDLIRLVLQLRQLHVHTCVSAAYELRLYKGGVGVHAKMATHVVLDDGRALIALDEEVVVLEHEVTQLLGCVLRLDLQSPWLLAQLLQRALTQRRRHRCRRHASSGWIRVLLHVV